MSDCYKCIFLHVPHDKEPCKHCTQKDYWKNLIKDYYKYYKGYKNEN